MTSKVVSYKDLFAEFISASDLLESKIVEQLHEEIGSDLMALKLKISASELIEEVKSEFDQNINGLLKKIKNLSNQFYPSALDELGLLGALRSSARSFDKFSKVSIRLAENNIDILRISIDRQRQLYYIIEEILIKVIDDSNKNIIQIKLNESNENFVVAITDDQQVCKTILTNENFLSDLGIQKMHSRLNKLNAQISCEDLHDGPSLKIVTQNG